MKSLKLFTMAIVLAALSGCLSIKSGGSPGPQGPQGPAGSTEKEVIIVPAQK